MYNFFFSEVKEECGLNVISMEKIGIIEFEYVGSKELLEGHIYICKLFSGEIVESDGMKFVLNLFYDELSKQIGNLTL